ncbi:MAG: glycosyltransferase family 2 protein [Halobacteriota archaeon]
MIQSCSDDAKSKSSRLLPTVSVIVPCYNYGHFLPECVASILSQEGVNVDVLIIDDASPDGSGEVASALAEQDSRIAIIRHKINHGHIATYNEGLGKIQGDYVLLLSADDLLTEGALARATAVMEAHPSVGLVYGHPLVFSGSDAPAPMLHVRGWSVWNGSEWIAAQCRRGTSCIYSPEAVVRTSIQAAVGGYSANLPHTADLEMWLRIAAVSDVARVNGPDQALRRLHGASMMHTRFAGIYDDLCERQQAYESFFAGPGKNLSNAESCLRIVRSRLAEEAIGWACGILMTQRDVSNIDSLMQFAGKLTGSVENVRGWQELRRLRLKHTSLWDRLMLRAYALRRDLDGRIRWRRWRWSGI